MSRRVRIALGFAVGILALLAAPVVSAASDLDAATTAFFAGNYPEALELYDQHLRREPDSVEALYRSALILSWNGEYTEAIREAISALGEAAAGPLAVRVTWPDGSVERFEGLAPNAYATLRQGSGPRRTDH